jgi:hypothetical protein
MLGTPGVRRQPGHGASLVEQVPKRKPRMAGEPAWPGVAHVLAPPFAHGRAGAMDDAAMADRRVLLVLTDATAAGGGGRTSACRVSRSAFHCASQGAMSFGLPPPKRVRTATTVGVTHSSARVSADANTGSRDARSCHRGAPV